MKSIKTMPGESTFPFDMLEAYMKRVSVKWNIITIE